MGFEELVVWKGEEETVFQFKEFQRFIQNKLQNTKKRVAWFKKVVNVLNDNCKKHHFRVESIAQL